MSELGRREALRLLAWDARRRLLPSALVAAGICGGALALGLAASLAAPPSHPSAERRAAYSAAREALRSGDAHRREGRAAAALRAYEAVARDPRARADDARRARYGAARARLDAGEASALEELARLARSELAPHEIARARAAILRFADANEVDRSRVESSAARCLEALRTRAEVVDIDGERARRWLARITRDGHAP